MMAYGTATHGMERFRRQLLGGTSLEMEELPKEYILASMELRRLNKEIFSVS
jgi:hypothetical protein